MQMFHNATIDCDADTAKIYEYADGDDEPIEFPLAGVQVSHFGSRGTIMMPRPGQAALVLDRLIRAGEAKQQTVAGKEIWTITGASERLHMAGIDAEDAQVTFTIKEFSMTSGSPA